MDEDPANVAANWATYFDDENECNYYYNSVTQESSWSRPACMGFGNTGAVSQQTLEKQKSNALMAAAFGVEENDHENENEENKEPVNNPAPPVAVLSPKQLAQHDVDNSFDSNDEFFAQLEKEVDDEKHDDSSKEQLALRLKAEEELQAKKQAELEQIVADCAKNDKLEKQAKAEEEAKEKEAAENEAKEKEAKEKEAAEKEAKEKEAKEKEAKEKEAKEKEAAEKEAKEKEAKEKEAKEKEAKEKEAKEKEAAEKEAAEKEAKLKRKAELEKKLAEKRQAEEELKRKAAEVEAEFKAKELAKEKKQAELEKFMTEKKIETEAKEKADKLAEMKKKKEKIEAEAKRKAELIRMTSDVAENDEIPDKDIDISYSISMSKEQDDTPPQIIDDEPQVVIIKEKEEKKVSSVVSSEVVDTVEHNEAATKLQSLQRQRNAKKRVHNIRKDAKKKRYDEFMAKQESKEHEVIATAVKSNVDENVKKENAAIKVQSIQRRRLSQQKVKILKENKLKMEVVGHTPAPMNDSDISGQSSTASLHDKSNVNPPPQSHSIEISEIVTEPTKPQKPKQYYGYKEEESLAVKPTPKPKPKAKPKPIVSKKVPKNTPQKAIDEAAKYLEKHQDSSPKNPAVPETRSDELKLPEIVTNKSVIEPANRRKNRNNDLKHVNKRTVASLEKLEAVAKETPPSPLESKSAPPNGRLPKIGASRVSETERRKKKEPLFMRLEAQGRARSLALEKEKLENYQKIKASKREAKPSKEAIMEHMQKYVEQRKAHENKEREYAHAKKKELHEQAKLQKLKNKSPPRRKKLFDNNNNNNNNNNDKENDPDGKQPQPQPPRSKALDSSPSKKSTPRKVRKKLLKNRKLDFVEEEKERKLAEEKAKKERLAKGKMYGKVAPAKHAKNCSPPRKRLQLITDVLTHEPPSEGPVGLSIIPSPRSPRTPKKQPSLISVKESHSLSGDVDSEEVRDVIRSPRKLPQSGNNTDNLSPVLSIPKHKKRSPIVNRLSSLEDSNSSVPNINAPYDGVTGSEWVSQVMEMDVEEATLADVYESGFEMFMMEKGIIQDDL